MTDFMNETFSDWAVLAGKAKRGETILKSEVLNLLASEQPIPQVAKPLLAGLFNKEHKFQRGTASPHEPMKASILLRYQITLAVLNGGVDISRWPEDEQREAEALRKECRMQGATQKEIAKEIIADQFSISTRTLEHWLTTTQG
jgi:hypothetical protein